MADNHHYEQDFSKKLINLLKRWFIVGCYSVIIVLYILALYSTNLFTLFYSILLILPIRFLKDEKNTHTDIKSMVFRVKNFRNIYKIRTIISLILFLCLFSYSLVSILKNTKKDNFPTPVIEILSQLWNIWDATWYTLIYKTKDATEVSINGKIYDKEDSLNYSLEWAWNNTLNISISAKNEYKSSEKTLTITRNKPPQEIKTENDEKARTDKEKLQEESNNRMLFAWTLRNRFLDQGLDIEVSVRGKDNSVLVLKYALFSDVWARKIETEWLLDQWCLMWFEGISLRDWWDYKNALVCPNY